ncbi:MAG: BatD family protein [Tannerellaceae bacterium]|nr:BatD family protein [Tannerellaceae bacterium]
MKKLVFFLALFLAGGFAVSAQNITFKASAPQAVAMGEQFRLSYTINAEAKDLRIPELADFDVLMGPSTSSSHSTQIINGKMTSETMLTFTYILMPKKEGTFNIEPASIKVKNANYTSNAVSIKVLPADQAGSGNSASGQSGNRGNANGGGATTVSNEDIFMRMTVSKNSVYEQEGILVTFKLYTVYNPREVNNVKFPEFEGFLAQEIDLPNKQWVLENHNGRNYQTVVLKQTVLYPQRPGKLTIESGRLDAIVQLPSNRRVRSIFEDFFDAYQDVSKTVTTSPVTIDVKPLPSGKPASFSGAVGSFTMTTEINSTNVKANEAVTIKTKISGSGNIRLIKNPEVIFPNDFDIYDPKIDTDIRTTTSGTSGTRTIEYMAIPRYAGEFEIPAIQFSYFDPKDGTYKTLKSDSYTLHVERGEGGEGNAPVVSNFSNKESVRYLGQDIRYLKVKGIHFISRQEIFYGSFTYAMCYVISAILFLVFFVIYRRQVKENANLALVRTKKANKIAVRRLKNTGKLMKENKKEEFYEEVLRALWGYLSDKLNIPQANLTKDNVEAELTKYGVSETLISEFMEILNTCEFARYAPMESAGTMDKLYEATVEAIGNMENTIKK